MLLLLLRLLCRGRQSSSTGGGAAPDAAAAGAVAQRTTDVLYDFVAETDVELSVRAGEQVVIKGESDGWFQVSRVSDGQTGLIPASYVT